MKNLIYFDNASTFHPKPQEVLDYMQHYLLNFSLNPGKGNSARSEEAADFIISVRKKIANLFNVQDHRHIVFTANATHPINLILFGYFKQGDHALICNYSHNAVIRPMEQLKRNGLITYDYFKIDDEGNIIEESLIQLIQPNTKIIILNHASNVTGTIAPLAQIAKIAANHGLHLLLDCAQSAVWVPIDVEKYNIDFLVGTGHKTLMGPSGTGFMYLRDGASVKSVMSGGSSGNSSLSEIHPQTLLHKFEFGTINFMGIAGIAGSIAYAESYSYHNIITDVYKILIYAIKRLLELDNITLYGTCDVQKKFQ